MRDLSVKGVVRRYIRDLFAPFPFDPPGFPTFPQTWLYLWMVDEHGISLRKLAFFGGGSVRSALERIARTQVSFKIKECVYKWDVDYEQTWTHIVVRIELRPDSNISDQTLAALRNTWENTIESRWSNVWGAAHSGELTCPFTFDVQWVNSNEHYTVRVRQGSGQANLSRWYTTDSGIVASHEFGHMLGNPDEYPDAQCQDRSPVNTGTIMDNNDNNIPARLLLRLAFLLGSNIVSA